METHRGFLKVIVVLLISTLPNYLLSQEAIVFEDYKLVSDVANYNTVEVLAGDRNGNIDIGERITMKVGLTAKAGDFISTSVFITSSDPYVVIHTPKINFNDIEKGKTIYGNEELVLDIDANTPHMHKVSLLLKIMDSQKRDSNGEYVEFLDSIELIVNHVGPIQYGGAVIDDDNIGQSEGNNNMEIERIDGRIEIPLFLKNMGEATVSDALVKLVAKQPYVNIIEDTLVYDHIESSGDGFTPADYVFSLSNTAPASAPYLNMKLEITGLYNDHEYKWSHDFRLGRFFGSLKVSATPEDAQIIINDKFEGRGYAEIPKMPINNFVEIVVSKPGYETESFTVPVEEALSTEVMVHLMMKEQELLPVPQLNLKSWEDLYRSPHLLPRSKKVVNGGYFFGGLALVGLAYPANIAASGSETPGGSMAMANLMLTVPGITLMILSFSDEFKKEKPLRDNINKNMKEINERQELARKQAIETNKILTKEYEENLRETKKRNTEIQQQNESEQAKRVVEYRIGNERTVKIERTEHNSIY